MTSKPALKKRKTGSPGQAGLHFEALEPRLLLSADLLGGALATDYLADKDPSEIDEPGVLAALLEALAPTHSSAAASPALPELPPPVDLEALAGLATPGDDADFTDNLDAGQPSDLTASLFDDADSREVLFVDARVTDLQQLLDDLDLTDRTRDIRIVVLDPDRDGVAQVTETLLGCTDLDAVHFVTHGADGRLQLGDTWLGSDNLADYQDAVQTWQQALAEDADLLIYGCDLAASEDGRLLIQNLGALTGADVAASDDRTGDSSLGGDWEFEYQLGTVESTIAFTGESWRGVLASFTVNVFADSIDDNPGDGLAEDASGNTSLRAAIMEANALPGADTIILGAGTYTLSIGGTGEEVSETGDLDVDSELTITGAGAGSTFVDGGGIDRVFHIQSAGDVSMDGLTVQGGDNEVLGGGIRTTGGGGGAQLTLTGVVVRNNVASGEGAGIYNDGLLTLIDTAITGNNTPTGDGGGLLNTQNATLTGVTINGNTAKYGAGIYNDNQGNLLSLTNVTISGNTATLEGGGIYTQEDVVLTNVTIAKNSAATAGGIYLQGGQSGADLTNTILADNTGGNVSGTLTSATNSISTDATSGLMAATPLANLNLDTNLQNNGGPTATHALLAGSVAIDAGTNAGAPALDQRGAARVGTTDIGAYEFGGIIALAPTLDLDADNSAGVGGNDYQFTFTEGDGATAIADTDTDLADIDSITFDYVALVVSGLLDGNAEELLLDGDTFFLATAIPGQDTIGGNYHVVITTGIGTANLTVTKQGGGTFTEAETETLIKAIQYRHSNADNPSDGDRLIDVTVNDGTTDSAAARSTINVNPTNDAPAGTPAITGTVQEDSTLTANTGGITDDDGLGAFSYQWQRSTDGGTTWNNVGVDASTYTLGDADVGALMRVQVAYTDGNSTAEGPLISAATAAVTNINDAPAGTPAITGTVQEDSTLTADTGGITDGDGLSAFSYQWQRSTDAGTTWNNVGVDTATYVLGDADVGALMRVQVAYTDGHSTAEGPLTSVATAAVTNINDTPAGTPTITGTVQEDQTLTANTGGITDDDGLGAFSYQWQRSTDGGSTWNNVGVDASTYVLGDADVGALMRVQVAYTDANSTAEGPLTSAATAAVGDVNDVPAGTPAITGTVQEDSTLTADTGGITDDDGLGAFSYQWQRSTDAGTTWNNVGVDTATYVLGDADVGALMRVQVAYTDGHSTAEGPLTSVATAAVTNINDTPAGTPTITGTVQEDQTLTANTGGITDDDGLGAFSYQWQRSTDAGTTWNNVGVDASTYVLGNADVGALMRVQVSYTDAHSTAEGPLSSAATAAVTNVNDTPAGTPAITGVVAEDQTLTADTSGITDDDGLGGFSYQWQRSTDGGTTWNNVGADASTYVLGDADVGALMRVQVSYNDAHSTAEGPLISAATVAVANINDLPAGTPAITGTVQEDSTLTADTGGITDDDGLGAFSYQWQRSTDGGSTWNNAGVDASTYVLGNADVGALMRVQVSYTDAHSTAEGPLSSAATAAVTNVNDTPAGTPAITGTVTEDQTLTADTSGITDDDGLGAFSYQWQRSTDGGTTWNNVGADASTYTLGDADVGALMRVQVAYADAHSTAEGPLTSAATAAVTNVNDIPAGTPAITGTVTEDQTLTADTSGITDDDGLGAFSYQWQRSIDGGTTWNNVGADANTYTLGDADVGALMRVQVSYTDAHSTAEGPLTSVATAAVTNVNDVPVGNPAITGTVQEDSTLTADTSGITDDDGLGAFGYQWQRSTDGGTTWNNVGVDASTYVLGNADVGALMRVQVSYTDANSTAEGPLTSVATAAVVNINDAPSLGNTSLTLNEGQTVTVTAAMLSATDIDDADPSLTFTVSNVNGGHFALGATPATPITSFTQAQVTGGLVVFVDDGDEAAPSFDVEVGDGSASAGPVAATVNFTNQNDAPLGLPGITGTVTEDQVLSANTAGITDADGLGPFTYQWLRNGSAIGGATAGSYTLGDADVGALMSVEVRYTDAQGTVETVTSAQTAAVANVNDAPVLGNNRLAIADGGTVILLGADLSATDADDPDATLLFSVTNLNGGQFELVSNPGVAVTGFTQAQVTGAQVHFVHDGNGAAPAYEVSVSDSSLVDGPLAAVISFTATGNTIEPPPDVKPVPDVKPLPDIKPFPDVKPLADIEPAPEPIEVDNGEPDVPPADEAETDTTIEGVPGGSVTVVDEELLLPPVEIDGPPTPDADNDRGTASPGSQGALQTVMSAIATRPAALQALLGGVATAYGFSWGDLSALESDEYRQQLDRLRDDVAGDIFVDQTVVGSSIAVSTSLSVGYVLWLVRGGVLLSSVLSSLPAWRLIDPLPVLAYVKNRPEDDPDDGDSLESLVEEKEQARHKENDDETDFERGENR